MDNKAFQDAGLSVTDPGGWDNEGVKVGIKSGLCKSAAARIFWPCTFIEFVGIAFWYRQILP
jgi:hypothetical protein